MTPKQSMYTAWQWGPPQFGAHSTPREPWQGKPGPFDDFFDEFVEHTYYDLLPAVRCPHCRGRNHPVARLHVYQSESCRSAQCDLWWRVSPGDGGPPLDLILLRLRDDIIGFLAPLCDRAAAQLDGTQLPSLQDGDLDIDFTLLPMRPAKVYFAPARRGNLPW